MGSSPRAARRGGASANARPSQRSHSRTTLELARIPHGSQKGAGPEVRFRTNPGPQSFARGRPIEELCQRMWLSFGPAGCQVPPRRKRNSQRQPGEAAVLPRQTGVCLASDQRFGCGGTDVDTEAPGNGALPRSMSWNPTLACLASFVACSRFDYGIYAIDQA